MRQLITVPGLVVSFSAVAFSTVLAQAAPAAKAEAKSVTASHSTSGIVKSINTSTMVITRPGRKGGEMTFALNTSTQRDPTVAIGSRVTVCYQAEGKSMVATAITEQKPKQTAANKPAVKK